MRPDLEVLNEFCINSAFDGGAYKIPVRNGPVLNVIISWGGGWDHVSVSAPTRPPSWDEMCFIKHLFFHPEECVIQYHPPESMYVNRHPHVLHLWKPQNQTILMPPLFMV